MVEFSWPLFFIWFLVMHYVFDFITQTDEEATTKSTKNQPLLAHVGKYGIGVQLMAVVGAILFGGAIWWFAWSIFNVFAHFVTDYFTSRWSSSFRQKGNSSAFFNVIGFDQLIHQFTLGGTAVLLVYILKNGWFW